MYFVREPGGKAGLEGSIFRTINLLHISIVGQLKLLPLFALMPQHYKSVARGLPTDVMPQHVAMQASEAKIAHKVEDEAATSEAS